MELVNSELSLIQKDRGRTEESAKEKEGEGGNEGGNYRS
jgi:hypothetical protein